MNCLAKAVAAMLDLDLESVYAAVGHRGDEMFFPDVPEPYCRRGFHFDEFQSLCMERRNSIIVCFEKYVESRVEIGGKVYVNARQSTFYPLIHKKWPIGIYLGVAANDIPHAEYSLAKRKTLEYIDAYLALVPIVCT